MPSALVFGASGQLGAAVAQRLLAAGWTVFTVTREGRSPPDDVVRLGARLVDGTGRTRATIIDSLDAPLDAVFDPTAYDRADANDLLAARDRIGALVVVSSASVYAAPDGRSLVAASQSGLDRTHLPISEGAPIVAPDETTYAGRKVALEQTLLTSDLPVSILRPCAVHGPYSSHPREWWFIKRALDGRPAVPVAYNAKSVFHTSSAAGLADLALRCLEQPTSGVLNVADDDAPSVAEIAHAVADCTGLTIPLAPFDGPPVGPSHIGSTPWSTEHPLILDTARTRALGWSGGLYRDRIASTCRWALDIARARDWREHFTRFASYGYDPFDYPAEDAVLTPPPAR